MAEYDDFVVGQRVRHTNSGREGEFLGWHPQWPRTELRVLAGGFLRPHHLDQTLWNIAHVEPIDRAPAASSGDQPSPSPWGSDKGGEK